MNKQKIFPFFIFLFLSFSGFLLSHEGHHLSNTMISHFADDPAATQSSGNEKQWIQWIGTFHFIFVHFPIALIYLIVIAEWLFYERKMRIYDHAARFMLLWMAILCLPTIVTGYIYSTTGNYTGWRDAVLDWHMALGIIITFLAFFAVFLREYQLSLGRIYYLTLVLLFLCVNIAGFLGGTLTFGLSQVLPPI